MGRSEFEDILGDVGSECAEHFGIATLPFVSIGVDLHHIEIGFKQDPFERQSEVTLEVFDGFEHLDFHDSRGSVAALRTELPSP